MFRILLPPLVNNIVSLLKDSSLAYVIGVVELSNIGNRIQSATFQPIPVFITTATIYLILTTVRRKSPVRLNGNWTRQEKSKYSFEGRNKNAIQTDDLDRIPLKFSILFCHLAKNKKNIAFPDLAINATEPRRTTLAGEDGDMSRINLSAKYNFN